MEYLEKWQDDYSDNNEGAFLGDWEVIFGAEKYKIMENYLDQRREPLYKILKENLKEMEEQERNPDIHIQKKANETNEEYEARKAKEIEKIKKDKDELEKFLEKKPYPSREKIAGHYHLIQEKLNSKKIEKYYKLDEADSLIFDDDTIIINPEAKSQIEYKYNPLDDIIGGELILDVKRTPAQQITKLQLDQMLSALVILAIDTDFKQNLFDCLPKETQEKYAFLTKEPIVYDETMDFLKTAPEDLAVTDELHEDELIIKGKKFRFILP